MSRLNSFSTSLPIAQTGQIPHPVLLQSNAPAATPSEAPQESLSLSPDQLQVATSASEGPAAQVSFGEVSQQIITHQVQKGETLSDIAGEYLGNRNRYMEVYNVNTDVLHNPDDLRIGMQLQVYLDEKTAAAPTAPAQPPAAEAPTHAHHRVRRGENLSDIAQKFLGNRNRYMEIYEMNRHQLNNPNDLRIGMVLDLPLPPDAIQEAPAAPQPVQNQPASPTLGGISGQRPIARPETPAVPATPTAPSLTPPAELKPPAHFIEHTVGRGESLSELALNYYGDSERYMDIFDANTDRLSSPDSLKLGMKLRIPTGPEGLQRPNLDGNTNVGGAAPIGLDGMTPRATELYQAMQRYQQYHAQRGNTQRTRTTQAEMREIAVELDKAGAAFNVDPKLMLALFAHESGGINARARSHTGAGGLGQLTGIAIRQVHHMSGIAKGFTGKSPYRQHRGNFVQSTRSINQRYNIKANIWTSTAYMRYELTDRSHLGRGVERALKRYGDPNVPTYANKVNAEYKTLFGGRLF